MRIALLVPALLAASPLLSCGSEAPADGCSIAENTDGTKTLSCSDGTSATIRDGERGPEGSPGVPGAPGEPGADAPAPPCTTLSGDVTLAGNADAAYLAALGCTVITGTLKIDAPGFALGASSNDLVLPGVISVGGLNVYQNAALGSLRLPALRAITKDTVGLHLRDNPGLTTVSLPSLETGFAVQVNGNPVLTALELPALTTTEGVAGDLSVFDNAALETISLPALTSVSGFLGVNTNPALTTLDLPALVSVGGAMQVVDNALLRQCLVDAIKNRLTSGPASYTAYGNGGTPNTCP